jgi:hypothetical protein
MKWSWKSFFIQLVAVFVAALGVSYVVSKIIDIQRGPGAADSTILSMGIGGFLTSILFAALCGWRGWNFKMLLVIVFVVAGLYSANPAVAILVIPFAGLTYFVTTKIKNLLSYYSSPVPGPNDEGDSEQ